MGSESFQIMMIKTATHDPEWYRDIRVIYSDMLPNSGETAPEDRPEWNRANQEGNDA